ncbi:MAG: N-acetylmuramoyl-L-alanine amidase [Lentisphaeria bacterium]|nr:N-acetylmuramoyl-L-alanine amidase [Lentisphaeria bacterium]
MMLRKLLLLCIFAAAWLQIGAIRIPGVVHINGRACRNLSLIASGYRMRFRKDGVSVSFSGGGRFLTAELMRRRITWNGMPVMLGYPVITHRGSIYVSDSDWRSTLSLLFFPRSLRAHRIAVITLDAGHGGSDQGAAGRISREKDITLKLTKRVAAILQACRYRVHLTRTGDAAVPLKTRAVLQRNRRSDLFISIHVNAARDRSVSGVETYCLTPADAPSSNGKPELGRNLGNIFDANNFSLACRIQSALRRRTGAVDRGVKRARFAVLRDISAPGVLIETGFISNPEEEKRLNDPAHLEKIARGIAEGIVAYHVNLPRSR